MPTLSAIRLDFRKFEQGLQPPDYSEAPVDDLTALKDVIAKQMGHSSTSDTPQDASHTDRLALSLHIICRNNRIPHT
ncbi:hypothetical protein BGZ98_007161, partial [Dissophora globulifera]